MARRRWYEKYIGYCFTHDGKVAVLEEVFYWVDVNGKKKGTGYTMFYPEIGERVTMDYTSFMRIRNQTRLPPGGQKPGIKGR